MFIHRFWQLKRFYFPSIKILKNIRNQAVPDGAALHLASQEHSSARDSYRQAIRSVQRNDSIARDQKLQSVKSSREIFRVIRGLKSVSSRKIHQLSVEGKIYHGDSVPDGFFHSLRSLKSPDMSKIHSSTQFRSTDSDFHHIIQICQSSPDIPEISYKQATEILLGLRSEVRDYYSLTPNHFINAGRAGFDHFYFLLNSLIKNIKLASLEELNTAWACILYKGHGKNRCSDRSYRTISTCPLLAKALDVYVGQLHGQGWANVQAPTQFQGTGSSHELAALLPTECIQSSLCTHKRPDFVLLLDAKSAFDKVV